MEFVPNAQPPELSGFKTQELFALYRAILAELKSRGIVRSENAPAGDYAEHLVAIGLGGDLAPSSDKSWDVRLPDAKRIQVKTRVVSDPPRAGQRQLSPFRSFDFDAAIIVLLKDSDYSVLKASMVPKSVIEGRARFRQHVNGYVLVASDEVLEDPLATDLTEILRREGSSQST